MIKLSEGCHYKETNMGKAFERIEIKSMELRNRFVRSATWEGLATDDGACTPRLVEMMAELAKGEVGLIITGHAYVQKVGQASFKQLGIYDDHLVNSLLEMASAVHKNGGKIVLQLSHAGFFANPDLTGMTPIAPSQIEGIATVPRKEMTVSDIKSVMEAFIQAAHRAKRAGFDGIEIHAAHGYLLSQFISPFFNKRNDSYGGSLLNRARALREVVQSIKRAIGEDFPILVKMNSEDFVEGGLSVKDSVSIGALLQESGVHAIEVSGGTSISGKEISIRTGIHQPGDEAYFKEATRAFKQSLQIPIILVGGIRSLEVAENLLQEGFADLISMSRPFIREPDLIRRWASGDQRKAACISDNQCFIPGASGAGIYCVVDRKRREQQGDIEIWTR